MTSTKTIGVNNWSGRSWLKRVRGKRCAVPDAGGDAGRAEKTGEAHQERRPAAKANESIVAGSP